MECASLPVEVSCATDFWKILTMCQETRKIIIDKNRPRLTALDQNDLKLRLNWRHSENKVSVQAYWYT